MIDRSYIKRFWLNGKLSVETLFEDVKAGVWRSIWVWISTKKVKKYTLGILGLIWELFWHCENHGSAITNALYKKKAV